jgi:hypothetical protein
MLADISLQAEGLAASHVALLLLRCPAATAAVGRPCDRLVGVKCEGLLGIA